MFERFRKTTLSILIGLGIISSLSISVNAMSFEPESITRHQVAEILYDTAGAPNVDSISLNFDDIPEEKESNALRWVVNNGIMVGYGDGEFGVNDILTNEQMVTVLYRYAQLQGEGFKGAWAFLLDFDDVSQVSDYAYEPYCWFVVNKLIGDDGINKLLYPKSNTPYASFETLLNSLLNQLSSKNI